MKKIFYLSMLLALAFTSCTNSTPSNYGSNSNYGGQVIVNSAPDVVVTPASNLGDNLDLQALGELVKTSKNAQDIENKLNQPNSINNLDLDGDGKVDYIKVTEYGSGTTKGFSFTVDAPNSQTQEIATIELQQGQNQQANMNINGNQTLYGNNAYYTSNYSMTDLLIWHYLFYPHPYYVSPWHYGYYPSYYHSYGMVPRASYSSRISTTTRTSRIVRSTSTPRTTSLSPNRNAASSLVSTRAKSLANPVRSKKSFSSTSNSRPSTGGFKSSPSKPSSSGSSWFGSSKGSSSSRSSGSSWGSSSRSSRSSGSSFGSSSRSSSRGRR